jgi:hypothetical protein
MISQMQINAIMSIEKISGAKEMSENITSS